MSGQTLEIPVLEGHTSNLALWDTPVTNTAVENICWEDYRPLSQITPTSAIEFNVPGTGLTYYDLTRTRLQIRLKVTNADGSNLPVSTSDVALINLAHATLFSQVDVVLQQKLITQTGPPHYAYKGYLDTLLNYGQDAKDSYLQSQFWHADSAAGFDFAGADPPEESHEEDNPAPDGGGGGGGRAGGPDGPAVPETEEEKEQLVVYDNSGWTIRAALTRNSREVQLEGPLHNELFTCPRYLLNGVALTVKCWQSSDAFRLMSYKPNAAYKVLITDAVLKMAAITVNPDVILAHDRALRKAPALYPYLDSEFKSYSIGKGLYNFSADNLYLGRVPSKMMIMIIPSAAYSGDYTRNPLQLMNANVSYMSVKVDNQEMPSKALEPNFDSGNYTDAYVSMFTTLNFYGRNEGNSISLADYSRGYAIFAFDLDSQHDTSYLPAPKRGNCRLAVNFRKALDEPVTLLIYSKHPSCIRINHARGVFM